jgi:SAM-dependent methyltransferase
LGKAVRMTSDEGTRAAWAVASQKYEREYSTHLEQGRVVRLLPVEEQVLTPIVSGARVVHPMSGHGLDDLALIRLGAAEVIGVDYSQAAVDSAQRRADDLKAHCSYVCAEVPGSGLPARSADLVYTGKGALIWVRDLDLFLVEMRSILRPGGALFVYEAHPLSPLWSGDRDQTCIRPDRNYFSRTHENDSFPARGAVECQRTLAETVNAVLHAGFSIRHFEEHPEPFWRPGGAQAAAWNGQLPNSYSLLARLPDTDGEIS